MAAEHQRHRWQQQPPLINALTYTAKYNVPLASCNSTSFAGVGSALVNAGSLLTAGSGATTFALSPAPDSSTAGTPTGVCLGITLPSTVTTAVSGLATSPVWQFNATSN